MPAKKVKYTDKELAQFKKIILAKIQQAEEDLEVLKGGFANNANAYFKRLQTYKRAA